MRHLFLLIICSMLFSFTYTQSNYEWYCNERFEQCIQYPINLIPQGEPQNGDGQEFISEDETVSLIAYGRNYQPDFDEGFEVFINAEKEYSKITYKVVKQNYCILSGYTKEGNIFYQKVKYIDESQSQYWIMRIEYPESMSANFEKYCKIIAKS